MSLYPEIEPYDQGLLDVGDGHQIFWEVSGNPSGKPAVVLHGGPGSGCVPGMRRYFDPSRYKIVLFDQRNCGRSLPHASALDVDLSANTTWHLVADMELLRARLEIERWLILGGSWGSVLGVTYAEAHPIRVSEMVLFGSPTGRHCELDWLFRGGLSILFPEQWERLVNALPPSEREGDISAAYYRRLMDSATCRQAAEDWCRWESATPTWPPSGDLLPIFQNPDFALAFARIVTHYTFHNLWLEDGVLLRNAGLLADIPGVLLNGRFDFQAPIGYSWLLKNAWPGSALQIFDDAGHSLRTGGIGEEIVRTTDRFARPAS